MTFVLDNDRTYLEDPLESFYSSSGMLFQLFVLFGNLGSGHCVTNLLTTHSNYLDIALWLCNYSIVVV